MRAIGTNTIFFIGAGFSYSAGAPLQSELLQNIMTYTENQWGYRYNDIWQKRDNVRQFLIDAFSLDTNQLHAFTLEDFYTPIDRCISDNSSFRGYSTNLLRAIRNDLSVLIGVAIDQGFRNRYHFGIQLTYLQNFSDWIVERNSESIVISTNWDILLETHINTELHTIDYGTSYYNLSTRERIRRRLEAWDGRNVKILKLHGSLNWLKCPSCQRLYVSVDEKAIDRGMIYPITCAKCQVQYHLPNTRDYGITLEPQIILPTFLKDLSNNHFKTIWSSAFEELTKAKELIFIGYSLPNADFEIRQLLARAVPDNCIITIIERIDAPDDITLRYKNFFGRREVNLYPIGVEEFCTNLR